MAPFPNNSRAREKPTLIPISKRLLSEGRAGCHNIAQLHRELVASGAPLTYKVVYKQLVRSLPEGRKNAQKPDQLPQPPILARQAVFLLLRRPEELDADEQETLALLRLLHAEMDQVYELVQQFVQMLRTRTGEQLDGWLERVKASQIRELQGSPFPKTTAWSRDT